MNIIASIDKNMGIGYKNKLLTSIYEDMQYFKEKTIGKIVIMGRNTFLSLPQKKALPQRTNIVITKNKQFYEKDIIVCSNIEESICYIKENFGIEKLDDVFFIGGEQIYKECIKYCNTIYLTKIYEEFKNVDKFFPNFNKDNEWKLISENPLTSKSGKKISFLVYKRK